MAEHWWGAGVGHSDLTYIKLATGVGAGFILSNRLYRGTSGSAGELGHIVVDPEGSLCNCGLRGCLVTRIGSQALLAKARTLAEGDTSHPVNTENATIGHLIDAAISGDAVARQVVDGAGGDLGRTVASLLNLMNPSVVVLGGGLTRAGDTLVQSMEDELRRRTVIPSGLEAGIVVSPLGKEGVAQGAATLVLAEALNNQAMFPVLTHMRSALR